MNYDMIGFHFLTLLSFATTVMFTYYSFRKLILNGYVSSQRPQAPFHWIQFLILWQRKKGGILFGGSVLLSMYPGVLIPSAMPR